MIYGFIWVDKFLIGSLLVFMGYDKCFLSNIVCNGIVFFKLMLVFYG